MNIPVERIAQEVLKMVTGPRPAVAIQTLYETGLLERILPEVVACRGVEQIPHHQEGDVWTHTLMVLENLPANPSPALALAALLHDIGKVPTQELREDGTGYQFHGHDIEGARMTEKICKRWKLANKMTDEVVFLVRQHMRIRRSPKMRPGKRANLFRSPYMQNLLHLLRADDLGRIPTHPTWEAIEACYERFSRTDVKPNHLGINGDTVMAHLGIKAGPRVGEALTTMRRALEKNPELTREQLLELI